jgi:plastocyanin
MPYRPARNLLFLTFAAVAFTVSPSWAATVNVAVGGADLAFHPEMVTINVGDTVMWTNAGGTHDVHADDNSFSSGQPSGTAWTFSHTFNSAGTFPYYCTVHGGPGGLFMSGTVVVQGSGPSQPGTLRFTLATYSVGEGAGTAIVSAERINGDDGAVSVQYSANEGSAKPGQDFTAVTGTLSWGNHDDSNKTFTVPIINDTAAEGSETVNLSLFTPTGGATVDAGRGTATLVIQDNDSGGGGGGTPAAPSNLQAAAQSTSEVMLTWTDNSNNETGFSIERRSVDGSFQEVLTTGSHAGGTASAVVPGLEPSAFYLFRVRATGGSAGSAFSNEAGVATLGNIAACVAGPHTLCVTGGRFMAEVVWRTGNDSGQGTSVLLPSAPSSGLFYFFSPDNIELLVKVLFACVPQFNRYWVYFAATTDQEFALVVTDTQTGKTKGYYNPLGRPAPPVTDSNAFATCP